MSHDPVGAAQRIANARNSYWYGADIVGDMDLGLIQSIERLIDDARTRAQKDLQELARTEHSSLNPAQLFVYTPHDAGDDGLRKLWLRTYFKELHYLLDSRVSKMWRERFDCQRSQRAFNNTIDSTVERYKELLGEAAAKEISGYKREGENL